MELKWLEDFICLNEFKSFRRSASERFVSQSAFSRRIKALEDWLGADLVDRSSYPIQLTHAGLEFVDIANGIINTIYKSKKEISALQRNPRIDLIIATHPSLAVTLAPQFLRSFVTPKRKFKYLIRNDLMSAESYLTALAQNTCDYLICYQHESIGFTPEADDFISKKMKTEFLIPVISPDNRQCSSTSINLIQYSPYTNLGKVIRSTLKSLPKKVKIQVVAEASVAETIKSFVLNGHGVAWLPASMVELEIKNKTLNAFVDLDPIEVQINITRHKNLRKSALFVWNQVSACET